jgi:hypothetical protein
MTYLTRFLRPTFILRVLAMSLILAPAAGVFTRPPFTQPEYVLVLDDSRSMRSRFPAFGDELLAAWKKFEKGEHPVVFAGENPGPQADRAAEPERYTDLEAALHFAASLFTPAAEKRVLLVSDGLTVEENMEDLLGFLRERKISVFALTPPDPVGEAGIDRLIIPSRVYLWEPYTVKGRIASSSKGELTVLLRRDGAVIARKEVLIDSSGLAEVEFTQEADRVGSIRYSLALEEHDAPAAVGEVLVAEALRLRYIGDDLSAAGKLIDLFREAGIDVAVSHHSDVLYGDVDLKEEGIIVLDDLPAPALDGRLMEEVRKAVGTEGSGLLVIGGRKSLGSDDYRGSPMEEILPVTVGHSAPPEPAAATLIIAMDTSFSMAFRGPEKGVSHSTEPRKIDVAKEGVKEVVKVIRPDDSLGIIGNSTDLFWIHPLGHVDSREEVLNKVDMIKPVGDGINFYSIVREAYAALSQSSSPVRHIIVFGDAEDIDQYEVADVGHSYDLIRKMSGEGITLSVLAIGQPADKDVPFLRTSTLLGEGDFYLISDLRALPKYFVSEYRNLSARNFVEEEIRPVAGEYSPLLNGVQRPLPSIDGMATVTPRRDTESPLRTDFGLPLVTLGRYGAGKTAVFTSDNGYRWSSSWTNWGGAKRFWLQLLFAIAADEKAEVKAFSSPETDGLSGAITLRHHAGGGTFPRWDKLWLHPRGEGAVDGPVELVRRGLAEYQSGPRRPLAGFRRYLLSEKEDRLEVLTEISLNTPPPPEDYPAPENWSLLGRLVGKSGGDWISTPDDITIGTRFLNVREGILSLLAIAAGLILLLTEAAVKNLSRR